MNDEAYIRTKDRLILFHKF